MPILYTTTRHGRTRTAPPRRPPATHGGPGTELTAMFAALGIEYTPTCTCRATARKMDERGPQWCRDHLEEIVDALAKEVKARKKAPAKKGASLAERALRVVPFSRAAARIAVARAIARAEERGPASTPLPQTREPEPEVHKAIPSRASVAPRHRVDNPSPT